MKRVSETDDDLVLEIPAVLGLGIVRVQPLPIGVRIEIENVRDAVGVGRSVRTPISSTTP